MSVTVSYPPGVRANPRNPVSPGRYGKALAFVRKTAKRNREYAQQLLSYMVGFTFTKPPIPMFMDVTDAHKIRVALEKILGDERINPAGDWEDKTSTTLARVLWRVIQRDEDERTMIGGGQYIHVYGDGRGCGEWQLEDIDGHTSTGRHPVRSEAELQDVMHRMMHTHIGKSYRRNPSDISGAPKGYKWELVVVFWPRDTSRVEQTLNFEVDSYDAAVRKGKEIAGDSRTYSHITNRAVDLAVYSKGELKGYVEWDFKGNTQNIRFRRHKRNPDSGSSDVDPGATEMFRTFHGADPDTVLTFTEPEQYPGDLAELGTLIELIVETVSGYEATIKFEGDSPRLCSTPDGKQLYIVSGDQSLDLASLHMSGPKWEKDKVLVGVLVEVTYKTQKEFDKFKTIKYYHEVGEESGVQPVLIYDRLNSRMEIAGGQYHVERAGLIN